MRYTGLALAFLFLATSASAQTEESVTTRLDRVERQLRAVRGGAPLPATTSAGAGPVTPVAVEGRLSAIEQRLTQLSQAVAALQAASTATPSRDAPVQPGSVAATGNTRTPRVVAPASGAADAADRTTQARSTAVAAIEHPDTGDAVEDAYSYGYRLYSASLYPEAEAALKRFVADQPRHRRTSYARNLLGRAYLDEGKPALASVAFYDNFDKEPKGERAAESLSWLGVALTKLNKPSEACRVYGELDRSFGATLTPEVRARMVKGRADARCPA